VINTDNYDRESTEPVESKRGKQNQEEEMQLVVDAKGLSNQLGQKGNFSKSNTRTWFEVSKLQQEPLK
jgi:hypothetical protein